MYALLFRHVKGYAAKQPTLLALFRGEDMDIERSGPFESRIPWLNCYFNSLLLPRIEAEGLWSNLDDPIFRHWKLPVGLRLLHLCPSRAALLEPVLVLLALLIATVRQLRQAIGVRFQCKSARY